MSVRVFVCVCVYLGLQKIFKCFLRYDYCQDNSPELFLLQVLPT